MSIRTHFARSVFVFVISAIILLTLATANAQEIMPLSEIKKGDKGYGFTVFEGTKPEKFNFEVLGITNTPPAKYLVVLLSGGPKDGNGVEIIKNANIIAGMSGSPLFKDGKTIGALSITWPYAKEPLALATPIEYMINLKTTALLSPNNLFYFPALFPVTFSSGTTNDPYNLSAGDAYIFCDVWGDNDSCQIGTITIAEHSPSPILYALGHAGEKISLGPTAIPVWKGEVITTMPSLYSSSKLAKETGGIVGSVIFNSPVGQVIILGTMPRSIDLVTTVEDALGKKIESKSFLAYTPNTGAKISSIILGKKSAIFSPSNIEAEIKIDIADMPQILIKGALGDMTNAGPIVSEFLGNELDPIVKRIAATLRARPKYKKLQLKKLTVEVREIPGQKNEVSVEISVEANGDREWAKTLKLNLDKKYLDKELHISRGEDVVFKILLDPNFNPNIETVNLLNQISEKDALYLYYLENVDEKAKTKLPLAIDLGESSSVSAPKGTIPLSQSKLVANNKPTPPPTNGWTDKPRAKVIEILAKIDLPSNEYLITGEEFFVFKLPEPLKKSKRFFIF